MPIRLPPGSSAAALCRPEECTGCGARAGDRDARTAALPLAPLLRDGMAMSVLRGDWLRLLPFAADPTLSRLDDQQLLDTIGAALASGQLLLCPGRAEAEAADAAADPQAAAAAKAAALAEGERQALPTGPSPPPPPAARAAPPPPAAAAPPPPAPPPPVEIEIDAAAMTAVLLAAARDGVPFCEECEKARKAREAAPA